MVSVRSRSYSRSVTLVLLWLLSTLAIILSAFFSLLSAQTQTQTQTPATSRRHLLIVVDGLRPDYVTADVMPTLTALGQRGAVFTRHHSVYPTVTRVNASSFSTGAYPETHGLLGNSVFFPRVDAAKFLDTADYKNLQKIAETEGRLLTAPTLAESLQAAGRRMLVVSSGSSGSAFLNNHLIAGGAILHPQFVLPASLSDDMKVLGMPPTEQTPHDAIDRYAVDAFFKVGIPKVDPSVTVMWLGSLDSVAHDKGIGDPATIATLRHIDTEIKRVEDGLKAAGLFDSYDIWVTSDHGFSTHTGGVDLAPILKPFAGAVVATGGGAIYVRDGDETALENTVAAIVTALQRTPGVGAIFTKGAKAGDLDGHVPGTLSFDAARWNHARSAQILFSPDWTDAANAHGIKGSVAAGGTAGHGSSSPWDIHNTLIAAGPDIKPGLTIDAPSGNVDFAPTFLKLLGIAVPTTMQGRPLEEALVSANGGRASPANAVRKTEHTVRTSDGGSEYSLTAMFSIVTVDGREYRYLDGTRVTRKVAETKQTK